MSVLMFSLDIYEQHGFYVAGRFTLNNDAPITTSDITNWEYRIFDPEADSPDVALVEETALGAAFATDKGFFDTLQTDNRWKEDGTGYNFRMDFDGDEWTMQGGYSYDLEVKVNTSEGNKFAKWTLRCRALRST